MNAARLTLDNGEIVIAIPKPSDLDEADLAIKFYEHIGRRLYRWHWEYAIQEIQRRIIGERLI